MFMEATLSVMLGIEGRTNDLELLSRWTTASFAGATSAPVNINIGERPDESYERNSYERSGFYKSKYNEGLTASAKTREFIATRLRSLHCTLCSCSHLLPATCQASCEAENNRSWC